MAEAYLLPHHIAAKLDKLPPDLVEGVSLGMRLMGAPAMWAGGFDGTGVVVGVLDTGIDGDHPDLRGRVVSHRDYVHDNRPAHEWHPHGTHVAGTIAAHGALKGVAPGATLRDYRVLGVDGSGTVAAITQALRDAVDEGCQVVNLSLGSPQDDPKLHEAVRYAIGKGCLVAVAVGNEGGDKQHFRYDYPGAYPEVVGVGAVSIDKQGQIRHAEFSNVNDMVDVAAPGVNVVSCAPGGGYLVMSGTSMASPHGAGFAALLLQKGRARLGKPMQEEAAWEDMKWNTVDVDDLGIDADTGAGFLCLYPTLPTITTTAHFGVREQLSPPLGGGAPSP